MSFLGEYINSEIKIKIDEKTKFRRTEKKKNVMFPLRIELRTFRVLSGCDNHYTTETTCQIVFNTLEDLYQTTNCQLCRFDSICRRQIQHYSLHLNWIA